jgi:hypothetical protein
MPNAGDVEVDGGVAAVVFARTDAGSYTFPFVEPSPFAAGASVTFVGRGGSEIGAFTQALDFASEPLLVGDPLVSTTAAMMIHLSAPSTGGLQLLLSQTIDGGFDGFSCEFQAGQTQYAVPQSMLSGRTGTARIGASVFRRAVVPKGAFEVRLETSGQLKLSDGGLFFDVRFQ